MSKDGSSEKKKIGFWERLSNKITGKAQKSLPEGKDINQAREDYKNAYKNYKKAEKEAEGLSWVFGSDEDQTKLGYKLKEAEARKKAGKYLDRSTKNRIKTEIKLEAKIEKKKGELETLLKKTFNDKNILASYQNYISNPSKDNLETFSQEVKNAYNKNPNLKTKDTKDFITGPDLLFGNIDEMNKDQKIINIANDITKLHTKILEGGKNPLIEGEINKINMALDGRGVLKPKDKTQLYQKILKKDKGSEERDGTDFSQLIKGKNNTTVQLDEYSFGSSNVSDRYSAISIEDPFSLNRNDGDLSSNRSGSTYSRKNSLIDKQDTQEILYDDNVKDRINNSDSSRSSFYSNNSIMSTEKLQKSINRDSIKSTEGQRSSGPPTTARSSKNLAKANQKNGIDMS